MVYLVFIMSLFLIRLIAGYDSRHQKGKYVTIQNTLLCKVLLSRSVVVERKKRLKKDQNKMSVWGIAFYAAAGVVLLVNLFFLFVNDIPVEPWVIDSTELYIYADTLNEKVSALVVLILFASLAAYFNCGWFCYTADTIKAKMPKWVKIFVSVVVTITLLSVAALSIYFIFELVSCFL